MKAAFAFAVVFALALFAPTGRALAQSDERSTTQSDSLQYNGGGTDERDAGRPCNDEEWGIAANHCFDHHAPTYFVVCNMRSCNVQGNLIIYTWSGMIWGLFADAGETSPLETEDGLAQLAANPPAAGRTAHPIPAICGTPGPLT